MKNLNRIKPSILPELIDISSKQGQSILINQIKAMGNPILDRDIIKKDRMIHSMIDMMIEEIQSI
jgi:hypothetical protein